MGTLATRISHFNLVGKAIRPVLEHFDKISLKREVAQKISTAVGLAFSDELLFEKFQMWNQERDDDMFLFHINRFFEKQGRKPLLTSERDLTDQRENVEASIKESVRNQQKRIFGQRLTSLATERNLLTNDQLGKFLDISGEQARKFKGAIWLTPKGRGALGRGPSADLYRDILNAGVFAWNWGFEDRYPDFDFIQAAARELIAQLWQWRSWPINAAEFFESVYEGFDEESSTHDAHEWVVRCFNVRFFERFCVPFGILRDLSGPRLIAEPSDPYEKTEFFVSDFPRIVMNR